MQIGRNPIHRRIITPWYDTDLVCWIVVLALLPILLFGLAGLRVAHTDASYQGYAWVPALLLALSALLIVMNLARLLTRWVSRIAR